MYGIGVGIIKIDSISIVTSSAYCVMLKSVSTAACVHIDAIAAITCCLHCKIISIDIAVSNVLKLNPIVVSIRSAGSCYAKVVVGDIMVFPVL